MPMIENHIAAPVREIIETCYECHGTGKIYKDHRKLSEFLWDKCKRQRAGFRELMMIYRDWKESGGFVDCEECDGCGEWIKFQ